MMAKLRGVKLSGMPFTDSETARAAQKKSVEARKAGRVRQLNQQLDEVDISGFDRQAALDELAKIGKSDPDVGVRIRALTAWLKETSREHPETKEESLQRSRAILHALIAGASEAP